MAPINRCAFVSCAGMGAPPNLDDDLLDAEGSAGFVPFPAKPGVVVTDELVNTLRDAEGL